MNSKIKVSRRETLWLLLEEPDSSWIGWFYSWLITGVVIASVTTLLIKWNPFAEQSDSIYTALTAFNIVFCIDVSFFIWRSWLVSLPSFSFLF